MHRVVRKAAVTLFAIFSCGAIWAQTAGSISGTVKDPTGEVIPDIAVVVRNVETGAQQTVNTNSEGYYNFTTLPVGHYEVEAFRPGFKPYKHTGLAIDVGTTIQLDLTMEMGEESEQVTVSDTGIHVETESTEMGEVMGTSKMTSIPLNGRSFTDLMNLQPGVTPVSSQAPNAIIMSGVATFPPSGDQNPGNTSISGQRETANGFSVNGSDVEEDLNMGTAILPNLDSISEFRVLTNNFDAEYGNFSGGQVIVVTKSGTNQFHGDVFEFLRNTAFDARNPFSPQRAEFDRNQFGGTVGGPIKSNKVFFFADYQGSRTAEGVDTGLISVPTQLDRSGNLSDLASSLTGTVNGQNEATVLSQELGEPVSDGEPFYTQGRTNSSQCVLPNASIPQGTWSTSHWSAPSRNLLQYIPAPNINGNQFDTSSVNEVVRDDKGAIRVDANTSRWGTLSAYYFADDYWLNNPYPQGQGGASVPGFNAISFGRAQLISLSDMRTFGSNSINEFHFSYMRDANTVGLPQGGVGPSLASQGFVTGVGTPGIVPQAPSIEGIENVVFNNYTIGVDITGLVQRNNTFQWTDTFTRVIGTHTIKIGGGFHFDQINTNPDATNNGTFSFNGSQLGSTGSDFADFLLGLPFNYTQGQGTTFYTRNKYVGFFAQDSWRVNSNLTLNYGVRWDRISPWSEKNNQLQALVPGAQSVVYPYAPEGLLFPGDPGIPRTIGPARDLNFAPRLGLAYSPNFTQKILKKVFGDSGKTSIRAGFGMFYTAFEGLSAGILYGQPPYGLSYTSPAPPLFAEPFITASSGANIGQKFPLTIPPFGASASNPDTSITAADWAALEPISGLPAFSPNNRVPYTESYMFSIERQIGSKTVFSASYVGTQAHHLLVIEEANAGNPALCLSVSQESQVLPGTSTCGPGGESGVYITASGQTINGTRGPLGPAFGSDSYQKTVGNSAYNALQLNLRHTSAHQEFLVGYTYSKSIDLSSNLGEQVNPINPELSRSISAFDMRHNFVASYRYDLPVAHLLGRRNQVTDGWSLSGTTRFSTGLPVTLINNLDTSLLGTSPNGVNNNGVDTPNVAPGPLEINTNPRDGKPEFNTSLFSVPGLGQVGDASRRMFYGPGISNFDMALLKNVTLTEAKSLQFRLEAFNVFNHAQFYGPTAVNGNISSSNFGEVVSAAPPRILQLGVKLLF
jgi:hypothetical protein